MLRCFGIDDELVKINMYSDGADYTISNPTRATAFKKKFVDFNHADRDSGIVYSKEFSNDPNTRAYIAGMPVSEDTPLAMTFETQVIFPKKVSIDHPEYFSDSVTEQQIAFLGKYNSATGTYTGDKIFDIKVIKDSLNSTTAKFQLSFIEQGTPDVERVLETPLIEDVYDNTVWNFAVRIVPNNSALGDIITGFSTDYKVELYCVQTLSDVIEKSYSESITITDPGTYLNDDKYLSVGALYGSGLPESNTLDKITKVKISSVLFWYDDVTDEEINMHAFDASNYGRKYPSEPAYRFDSDFSGAVEVPRRDTLALHWEFSEVSTTDGNGEFILEDLSNEISPSDRYGWFTNLVGKRVTAKGRGFLSSDKQVVNREYVFSQKQRIPDIISQESLIQIREYDDNVFTRDAETISHFFAIEKSMYQVIDDDIINLFASIIEFNDIIGNPVNRYRTDYKLLKNFRQRYFEKVGNVPSLEKYVQLYKWIDSSVGIILQPLIPISANFSDSMRTMVESHVLERNKYWTKFPTLEMNAEPPIGIVKGINELSYNWKDGHAPYGTETVEDNKYLWGDQRVNRDDALATSGDADVDENRETIRRIATRKAEGLTRVVERNGQFVEEDKPILRTTAGQSYEGRAYLNRALSKPYRMSLNLSDNVHGGVNYSPTYKDPNSFIRSATRFIPGSGSIGIEATVGYNPETYEEWKKKYNVKRSISVVVTDTELSSIQTYDGDVIYPFHGNNYKDVSPKITGIHSDSYGEDAEIPAQGPFTETWVGGNQHRHVEYLKGHNTIGAAVIDSTSAITVTDHPLFTLSDNAGQDYSAAFSFWVKPNFSSGNSVVVCKRSSSTVDNREYMLYLGGQDIHFVTYQASPYDSYTYNTTGNVINTLSNEWHHIVVNIAASASPDSTVVSFYIDGVLVGSETENDAGYTAMQDGTTDLVIGNLSASHGSGLEGELRDLVIFNFQDQSSGLSQADVNHLLIGNVGRHPRATDIVGWWKLYSNALGYPSNGTETNITYSSFDWLFPMDRPELYVTDEGVIKHPQEFISDYELARYTREEVAKRPINIKNIKTGETRALGNYSRDYEVVQTSGRTQNNRWFTKLTDTARAAIPANRIPFISGSSQNAYYPNIYSEDYTLPDRLVGYPSKPTKHIFAERFSAPW